MYIFVKCRRGHPYKKHMHHANAIKYMRSIDLRYRKCYNYIRQISFCIIKYYPSTTPANLTGGHKYDTERTYIKSAQS